MRKAVAPSKPRTPSPPPVSAPAQVPTPAPTPAPEPVPDPLPVAPVSQAPLPETPVVAASQDKPVVVATASASVALDDEPKADGFRVAVVVLLLIIFALVYFWPWIVEVCFCFQPFARWLISRSQNAKDNNVLAALVDLVQTVPARFQ